MVPTWSTISRLSPSAVRMTDPPRNHWSAAAPTLATTIVEPSPVIEATVVLATLAPVFGTRQMSSYSTLLHWLW